MPKKAKIIEPIGKDKSFDEVISIILNTNVKDLDCRKIEIKYE